MSIRDKLFMRVGDLWFAGWMIFILVFVGVALYGHTTTKQAAETLCAEVEGRDYAGCVDQQYATIRRDGRME